MKRGSLRLAPALSSPGRKKNHHMPSDGLSSCDRVRPVLFDIRLRTLATTGQRIDSTLIARS